MQAGQTIPPLNNRFVLLSLFFLLVLHTLILTVISPLSLPVMVLLLKTLLFLSLRPRLLRCRRNLLGLSSNLLLPLHVHPPTEPSFVWVTARSALVL